MSQRFDLVIIGSGPGGYVAAIRASQNGLRTALVEKAPVLGGTCLHRGCIPTKSMLHAATLYEDTKHAREFGVLASDVQLDMSGVLKRKDRVVTKNAKGIEFLMKKNKVQVFQGFGRLEGAGKVSVEAGDGQKTLLEGRNILVATGSACRDIPAFPADHTHILNSDDMFFLSEVPESMVVLGAGAVGVEFASIFLRFGSRVTLIEMLPRILPLEDPDISAELHKSLKRQKMTILTGARVQQVERTGDGVSLSATLPGGETTSVQAQKLLVAIGRRPVTEGIGLEKTRAVLKNGFVEVDDRLRSAEPGLYAIGDIVATPQLAHVASAEGILAVDHMAGKATWPINYDRVPSCTYCAPEVASVGLTEPEAQKRGYDVKVGTFPFPVNSKAAILGAREGLVKVVSEKRYDELLGIHIVGDGATNLIAEGGVALALEATTEALSQVMHPHPTLSEAILEAVHATLGHSIHI